MQRLLERRPHACAHHHVHLVVREAATAGAVCVVHAVDRNVQAVHSRREVVGPLSALVHGAIPVVKLSQNPGGFGTIKGRVVALRQPDEPAHALAHVVQARSVQPSPGSICAPDWGGHPAAERGHAPTDTQHAKTTEPHDQRPAIIPAAGAGG
eukprot:scaffold1853_cov367-Prasinococcus_capsulatus_cf.AAC.6